MPTPNKSIRFPAALLAAMEAEAQRSERSLTDVVVDTLAERFLGEGTAPAREPPRGPRPATPLPAVIKGSALQPAPERGAEASGKRVAARLDTSSVSVFKGGKRPAYQRGAAKGKSGR